MQRLHGLGLGGRLLLAFAVAGGLFGVATAVQADIPDGGTIHSCYQKSNGQLRVIDTSAGKTCNPSEDALSWSQSGGSGSRGPTGATGARGASGPSGPRGASGPSGPKGASGPSGPRGATGPTGPAGGSSARPDVNSFVSVTPFTAINDGAWHAMPGVDLPFTMSNPGPVQLGLGFSVVIGGSYVTTRIVLDGVPVPGSQRITYGPYGSTSAINSTTLGSGPHDVHAEYKTAAAFTFDPINIDSETASLQALAFDE